MTKQSQPKTTLTEFLKQVTNKQSDKDKLSEDGRTKVCWLLRPQQVLQSPDKYK